jgi:alpha-tubulin suppressor-like RCC1 family protein
MRALIRLSLVAPLCFACNTPAPDNTGADASALPDLTAPEVSSDAASGDGPTDANPLSASKIAAGGYHTCAVLPAGTVWCWGLNTAGQIGIDPFDSPRCAVPDAGPITFRCESAPREVAGLSDVVDVAVGDDGTCALKRDGSVWCWGTNVAGQLGQGTDDTDSHPTPAQVMLPPASAVAYGGSHVCALLRDATVRCWGLDRHAQVGPSTPVGTRPCPMGLTGMVACQRSPREVAGLARVRQVSLGRNHSCALLLDGTVRCWGLNDLAQVGDGTISPADTARGELVRPTGLSGVTELAVGGSHACALTGGGEVWCWGSNLLGQLGAAGATCTSGTSQFFCATAPTRVAELAAVRRLAAGRWNTCAVLADGRTRCAGRNDDGQLGRGAIGPERCTFNGELVTCARSFGEVVASGIEDVALGFSHACARTAGGAVWCWGSGSYGQLGDGTTNGRPTPAPTRR